MIAEEKEEWYTSLLNDALVQSTYASSIRVEGIKSNNIRKNEQEDILALLAEEMAVLGLTDKQGGRDSIEKIISISRCAIKNLERSEIDRKRQHDNVMKIAVGSITALVGTILIWAWKLISGEIK